MSEGVYYPHIGNVFTKFFISFLAEYKDLFLVMETGALFHNLTASFLKVLRDSGLYPVSISLPFAQALVHRLFSNLSCLYIMVG